MLRAKDAARVKYPTIYPLGAAYQKRRQIHKLGFFFTVILFFLGGVGDGEVLRNNPELYGSVLC